MLKNSKNRWTYSQIHKSQKTKFTIYNIYTQYIYIALKYSNRIRFANVKKIK